LAAVIVCVAVFVLSFSAYPVLAPAASEEEKDLIVENNVDEAPSAPAPLSASTVGIPVHLIVPSINLDVPIVEVGIDNEGKMAVPDGKTGVVGWYQYGVRPGEMGSAVMSAHVYAAFSILKNAKSGDDIYVRDDTGELLHFVVEETVVYPLEELSPEMLFNRNDGKRLTLITCAGVALLGTTRYDHRLVVSAVLAE